MFVLRSFLRGAALTGVVAAAAIACSATSEPKSTAAHDADAAVTSDSAPADQHVGDASAKVDGKRGDGSSVDAEVVDLNGWTQEASPIDLYQKTGRMAAELVADPETPRRLLLRLGDVPGNSFGDLLAIVWSDGAWSKPLSWTRSSTPQFTPGAGGGIASDGTIYERIALVGTSGPLGEAHVAVFDGSVWDWRSVSQGFGSWPPRHLHVMPGTPTRWFLRTDSSLLEPTPTHVDSYVLASGLGALSLAPDRTTFLATVDGTQTFRRCTIVTNACTVVTPTGFNPLDDLYDIAISEDNADHVVVHARGPAPARQRGIYVSKNGATSFARLPLPPTISVDEALMARSDPDTWMLLAAGTASAPSAIFVTRDAGATWTELPLPKTKIVDISGLTFDAAGTVFLIRDGRLLSRAL